MSPAHDHRRLLVIRNLAVDQITGEVVGAFHRSGVRPLLLKGPALARWLYADGVVRGYTDSDLLVSPADLATAEHTLSVLGFMPGQGGWALVSRAWRRGTDDLDLHRSLVGVRASPDTLWAEFCAGKLIWQVGGNEVDVPALHVRAAHVALHAAQHGSDATRPLEDLRRALKVLPFEDWCRALDLVRRLDAEDAFAAGLRQLPAGAEVAERLDATRRKPPAVALRAGSPPPVALGVALLAESAGARSRIRVIARGVAPSPAYMRRWSPAAARSRAGLALAYLWRPIWLALKTPAAVSAWRQAARRDHLDDSDDSPHARLDQ